MTCRSTAGAGRASAWMLAVSMAASCLRPALAAPATETGPATDIAMAVSVVRAARHCVANRLAASGVFFARHEVELRPDRDGLVVEDVAVEAGDRVAKDQLLARLVSPQAPKQDAIAMKAPVAGLVTTESAIIGAYISHGAGDPLFRIAEDGAVELRAEILATKLSRVRVGMAAKIHVVGLGDIAGQVAAIDDGVDAQTQLGALRLSVATDPRLRLGAFARAEIDTGQECGLTIPLSALLFGPDGAVVGIVQSERVVMHRVTTGPLDGGTIEVRDGLTTDDLVIARAGPFLREGDHVRSVPTP